ncbi:PREDICTED: zinc finger protein 646 [Gekko japonicus]|uniref:Zinc finger protein 646 n=1 Tax=Gekko japonicus TaxID=146911 RepID=A0ABM1JLH0_GEKJA|nr:PREDICTED: zinc finger protein 646 [Gekko japonicus]
MAEGDVALACEPSAGQEERPYKCKQCPRSYRHAGSLVNHRRTHEVGLFPCLLCRKDFSNPMALKSHLRTHTEEKRHKCRDCGRSFRASSQLSSHRCMAHASRDQEEEEEEGSNSGGCTSQRGQDTSSSDADTYSGAEGGGSLLTNLEKYIADSVVPADFSLLEFSIKRDAEKEEALQAHRGEKEAGLRDAAVEERRFKCNQCHKAYKHAGSLTNHKQSHTLGVYQCSMCYKEFSNLMALKSHTRLHSEYRPYKCRFCHRAFRLPSELLSHQKAHDEEKTEAAGRPTWDGSEHSLWEEDSIETSAKLDIYQPPPAGTNFGDSAPCSLKDASKAGGGERCNPDGELCVRCGGTFANEEELKGHSCLYPEEANEEEGGGSMPSQLAPGSNGIWEASLKGEEDYHTLEERPFRCEDCGRTYRHAGSLINHKKSHQIGVYSCTVCSKQLYNLAALKNHLRVHLKSKLGLPAPEEASEHPSVISDSQQEEDSPREPGDGRIQPPDIWGGASSPKEDESGGGEEERPYRCGDCGRSYRHRGSLVNHRHTHQTGVFQCSICPKQYTNLMALRNHVRVHLRAARLSSREPVDCLTCTSCGESFEEEAGFQLHQLRHLPCSEDIEAAAIPGLGGFHPQEADLLQAIKQDVEALENGAAVAEDILPSSEMPYVCNQRGMTFASVASLQNHSLPHGGDRERLGGAAERPESPAPVQRLYGCDLCGKSYRHSGSLINHKQTHQTGDFSCSVCGKHFQNVASLKSHLRGHQRPRRAHSGTAVMANTDEDAEAGEGAALPGVPPAGEEVRDGYGLLGDGARANGRQPQSDAPLPSPGDGEVPPYLCEQCGTGFDRASNLESHKQTHQLGIYQCSLCPKEYPSLLALKSHFHGHTKATALSRGSPGGNDGAEEPPFLCSLCGMIFPSEEALQHHHDSAHEEGEGQAGGEDAELKAVTRAQVEDAEDPGEEQLLSHICGYCGETFDDMASLEEHSEGHQEEKAAALADTSIQLRRAPRVEEDPPRLSPAEMSAAADEPSDDRPYACGQCGKTYRHGGSLVNHKKIHQVGDYQCGACCRQYPNLSAYRNHLRNHPKCKLNGSVPEVRQPVPIGAEGPAAGCQKDAAPDGQVLVHEGGRDPPGEPSFLSPGREQRPGQEAALNRSPPEAQKTLVGDICGEEPDEKAAPEAPHGLCAAEEKLGQEETSAREEEAAPAGGEEDSGPGAEEEGSPSERPFRCEACGRSYKHAGSLINHKQAHKTGLFHCSVCQKQFYNLMALKNHHRTHFETKRYRCPECPKAFRLQKQLASHQRVHRDRKWDPSSRPSRRPPHARRAGKSEDSAHPLNAAKHRPDPEERPYQCGECGRTYRHAGSLLNHQKSHKIGHFACPLCSKAYPNLMSLKNHQRIHYEVKRHRCLDCGKAFKWQRQLVRHQRRPHPCSSSTPGQEHERNPRAPEKERGGSRRESPLGPFHCVLCSKQFPNRTSLRNHARVHSKKRFECSECGKAYRASRDLTRHLRKHREEAEAEDAEGDSSSSSSSSPMYPNTSAPPEEERPYKCDSCDRTYRHAGSLLNHKKAHATGLYRCPTCQKEFYNLLALKSHLHTHTDKKRHRCSPCGKAFRTARRLAAHAKVHGDPKEEGAPFACPVCSEVFSQQLSFQQHQLAHARDCGHSAAGDVPPRDGS